MEQTIIIMVDHGKVKKIANVFKVTEAMVSMSLRGKRNGDLAKKIRHTALEQFDGVEMKPVKKDTNEK